MRREKGKKLHMNGVKYLKITLILYKFKDVYLSCYCNEVVRAFKEEFFEFIKHFQASDPVPLLTRQLAVHVG